MSVIVLIPARLESTRLPNKPLLDIDGLPMIVHVAKRTALSKSVDKVVVCTDSIEILLQCFKYEIKCILTKKEHNNGTERIAEAAGYLNASCNDILIDVQGDEPLIRPDTIDRLVENFKSKKFDIMLPYIETSDSNNSNIVKISTVGNKVIYMSRSDIPYPFSKNVKLKKHLSIIAFTLSALEKYSLIKKIAQALEKSKLTNFVQSLPDGIDTILGEKGVRLSGGQRQRVALARAFYHDRDVLIMDESTSALDNETESEIVREIKQLKGVKTVIVIAHRLTTLKYCDCIYRLDNGKIVEYGSYNSIINKHNA